MGVDLALPYRDARAVGQRIGRMQHDGCAGLEPAGDLSFVLVALTELHRLPAYATVFDDEHCPALALTEESSDRNLEHVVVLPENDAHFDAVAISEPDSLSSIDEIHDDVHPLFFDAERGDLHDA